MATTETTRKRRAARQGKQPGDIIMGEYTDRTWLNAPGHPAVNELLEHLAGQDHVNRDVIIWRLVAAGAVALGYALPDEAFYNEKRPPTQTAAATDVPPVGGDVTATLQGLVVSAERIEDRISQIVDQLRASPTQQWEALSAVTEAGRLATELAAAFSSAADAT